ncbi:hypothetical protein FRC01_002289 [Tulasnella sp. 417]|nr:hypothetical protein FRC01_002289 [Tulasnella sp. 417]
MRRYGPGIYTHVNPASAHEALAPTLQGQERNYAIIQCRVVIQRKSRKAENSYAGFVDESGMVFCAQPVAIIPTHLLIYSAIGTKKDSTNNPNSNGIGESTSSTSSHPAFGLISIPYLSPYLVGYLSLIESLAKRGPSVELDLNLMSEADDITINNNRRRSRKSKGKLPNRSVNPDDDDDDFRFLDLEDPEDEDEDDLPAVSPSLALQPGATEELLLFYDQSQELYELSNYAPYPVTYRGKNYPTAEHLFQASKACI